MFVPLSNINVDFQGDLKKSGVRTIDVVMNGSLYLSTKNPLFIQMKRASVPYSFLNVSKQNFDNAEWYIYSSNVIPPAVAPALYTETDQSIYNASMMNELIGERCENEGYFIYSAVKDRIIYPVTLIANLRYGRFQMIIDRRNLPLPEYNNRYLAVYTGTLFKSLFGFTQDVYYIDTTLSDVEIFMAEEAPLLGDEIASGVRVYIENDLVCQSVHNTDPKSHLLGIVQVYDQSQPQGALVFPLNGQKPNKLPLNKVESYQNIKIRFVSALNIKKDLIFSNGLTSVNLEILTLLK